MNTSRYSINGRPMSPEQVAQLQLRRRVRRMETRSERWRRIAWVLKEERETLNILLHAAMRDRQQAAVVQESLRATVDRLHRRGVSDLVDQTNRAAGCRPPTE